VTAHAAFDKAGMLLDITVRHVKVDPETQKVDLRALKKAICRRTCMLVGSAPQFAHGSVDDIQEIAKIGLARGIPVHVDACLGGFLVCFMKEAGYELKPFDFSVPGVTSISADTHKYGYAPKGSSVILYSDIEYRHYQWFSIVDWPGGLYATSNIGN
jgi:sphinganine-1-phosphate aldolase